MRAPDPSSLALPAWAGPAGLPRVSQAFSQSPRAMRRSDWLCVCLVAPISLSVSSAASPSPQGALSGRPLGPANWQQLGRGPAPSPKPSRRLPGLSLPGSAQAGVGRVCYFHSRVSLQLVFPNPEPAAVSRAPGFGGEPDGSGGKTDLQGHVDGLWGRGAYRGALRAALASLGVQKGSPGRGPGSQGARVTAGRSGGQALRADRVWRGGEGAGWLGG